MPLVEESKNLFLHLLYIAETLQLLIHAKYQGQFSGGFYNPPLFSPENGILFLNTGSLGNKKISNKI